MSNLTSNYSSHRQKKNSFDRTIEYVAWQNMKRRVIDKNRSKNHGDKGVTICDRWFNSFQTFIDDVGIQPISKEKLTLDRIDNNKGYEPGNVRWATYTEQNRNKGCFKNSNTGIKGVVPKKNKYCTRYIAQIHLNYNRYILGTFDNIEDAIEARKNAEIKYWGTQYAE